MHTIAAIALAACAIAALTSPGLAQAPAPATPPAQPAAGGTPDVMPFDIPYGVSIGLERAKQVMAAAEAEAKRKNWKMNIAVVDTNGELVHFSRMEGAQIASVNVSIGKARTSARFRRESRVFYNAFETGHGYVATLDSTLVASPGGFPLVEGGKLIGAIGCSGGTGDQDAAICKVGADVVK
jgi:glc operon protein GlcG